mgnify:CR=1 FL=1
MAFSIFMDLFASLAPTTKKSTTCTARMWGLRPLVDGGATPLVVLFGIIDCMKIGDRGLVTCAVVALYHTSGAYSVVYESRVVGGEWCVDGTHMKSIKVCRAIMDNPKIIAAVGRRLTESEVGAMCVLAQLTFACLSSGGVDYATCMKRACRNNRTMLDNIPIFGVFLAALPRQIREALILDHGRGWWRPVHERRKLFFSRVSLGVDEGLSLIHI